MLEYKMNIDGELVSGFLAYVYVVKELGYDIKPLEEYDEVGFYRAEDYHEDIECCATAYDSYNPDGDDYEGAEIVIDEYINPENEMSTEEGFVTLQRLEIDSARIAIGKWGLYNNKISAVEKFREKVIEFDDKYDLDSKFWQKILANDCKKYNKEIDEYCKDKETLFDAEILHAEDILRLVLDEDFVEKFIKEWEI